MILFSNAAVDGELFNENVDATPDQTPPDPALPPPANQIPEDRDDRYGDGRKEP